MAAVHLNDKNFDEEVIKSQTPVLVDFWAEWCGPCKMIAPVLDEIAGEFDGKLKVGKVNVDEAQELAMQFNVMSIPTLIFFKNGRAVDQVIGAMGKEHLVSKIKKIL